LLESANPQGQNYVHPSIHGKFFINLFARLVQPRSIAAEVTVA